MIKRPKLWVLVFAVLLAELVMAQEYFEFVPKGGRQLLLDVLNQCPTCDDLAALVTAERTPEEWQTYFAGRKGAIDGLTKQQVDTLAAYLAINFPIPQPEVAEVIRNTDALPPDGRQLALEGCMFCHTIGVTAMRDQDVQGWKGIFRYSDHRGKLPFTEKKWETLAHYLTINMPIPEEEIPEELRQGAAVY